MPVQLPKITIALQHRKENVLKLTTSNWFLAVSCLLSPGAVSIILTRWAIHLEVDILVFLDAHSLPVRELTYLKRNVKINLKYTTIWD